MGTLELINFGTSIFGGAGITMASNGLNAVLDVFTELSKSRREEKQEQHDRDIEGFDKTDGSQKSAREHIGSKGFHKTRQWIAKHVIFCYFIVPMLMPFVAAMFGIPVEISIGYFDISRGWPWQADVEIVQWQHIGVPGGVPIVITPVMSNCAITIIGMFFGNQMAKK